MATIDPTKLAAFQAYKPSSDGVSQLDAENKMKTVDNGVSVISFFEKDRFGNVSGFLSAEPAPAEDKNRKDKILAPTASEIADLKADPSKFGPWLEKQIETNSSYLKPSFGDIEGADTHYKHNNIIGQRVDQVRSEATKLATETYPAGADQDKALFAVNTNHRDLYNRKVKFDHFEIDGYGSFGKDSTFLHAYEQKLEELNKIDADVLPPEGQKSLARKKAHVQAEMDAIFRNKYVYHSSNMQETDAEKTIGLVAIDQASRQRISEVNDTRGSIVPKFEILNLQHEGENKAVYFDASKEKYFFDGTGTEIPADQVDNITRKTLDRSDTANITFRRAKDGEPLREKFRFDWNGDGYAQSGKIDWVSWGGHCDNKAALESAGVVVPDGHKGVYEYNSASGSTAHYDRNKLNEILLSFSEMSSYMSRKSGGKPVKDIGETDFASARDDDRPDRLSLSNGRQIPFNARPNEFKITTVTKDGKDYKAEDAFREYLVADDKMSAEKNPLYKGTTDGDYVNLDLKDAVVKADVKIQVFDEETGYPKTENKSLTIDFANPPDEPVMIDSVMKDPASREMYEISLDIKNKKWEFQLVKMEKQDDGSFKRVELDEKGSEPFDPEKLVGKRETSLDNPETYMPFVRDSQSRGVNATAETSDGSGVWNGRMKSLTQSLDKREGNWERVNISVDARYGSNDGQYLAKLDDKGEPEMYIPLKMPADFFWRSKVAFSPAKDGLVNSKALERGVVTVENGQAKADGLNDMTELLHSAFNNNHYTIVHQGKRYFFETKAQFDQEVAKLEEMRKGVYTPATDAAATPASSTPAGDLVNVSGTVSRNEMSRHSFTASQDGEVKVLLKTKRGDADLYISKDNEPTSDTFDFRSWNSSKELDFVTLNVKAGETYNIGVHGYRKSKFEVVAKYE